MNIDLLLRHTATLITTPRDVAKLRQMILTLAVQGKLVPQEAVWNKYTLKNLTTKIGSGSTPEGGKNSYVNAGIPLIRSMNVHTGKFIFDGLAYLSHEQANKLNNVTTMQHDVLLNITGASIGRVSVIPDILVGARVNQHVCIIRPKSDIVPKYLEIVLASPQFQSTIFDIQVGATREALTKSMIESFEIPLPPLAEQRRIVARVDELMAICDTLDAQLQARAHMQARVVQAALARVQADPSPASIATLLDPKIGASPADLRQMILTLAVQGKLVSGIGYDNWKTRTISEITTTITPGFACTKERQVPNGYVHLRMNNVSTNGKLDLSNLIRIDPNMIDIRKSKLVIGDVLFNNTNSQALVGKTAIIEHDLDAAWSNHLTLLRFCSDIDSRFIVWYFTFLRNVGYFSSLCTRWINQAAVNSDTLKKELITYPPLAEQRRIVARVDELMALVDRLEAQQTKASALGAQVLDALVGGG